jgi:hypothetical protein
MSAGDVLVIHCNFGIIPYSHFGVDIGDGTVIHLATNEPSETRNPLSEGSKSVRQVTLEAFSAGRRVHVIEVERSLPSEEVVLRARSQLGASDYCLLFGNCEHFARWCKTGRWESDQVRETHSSIQRSMVQVSLLVASGIATLRSKSAVTATSVASARIAIPLLAGEITESITRCALKRNDASPQLIEKTSRLVGISAVAATSWLINGPIGTLTALAVHARTR